MQKATKVVLYTLGGAVAGPVVLLMTLLEGRGTGSSALQSHSGDGFWGTKEQWRSVVRGLLLFLAFVAAAVIGGILAGATGAWIGAIALAAAGGGIVGFAHGMSEKLE